SQLSEKYEFPDIKLASDDILRTYSSKNYQHYTQHIEKCLGNYQKLLKAKGISLMFDQKCGVNPHEGSAESVFPKQKAGKNQDPSKKVLYWNKMALLQYYKNEHDFEQAKKYALELLENLHTEPRVFSNFEFAQA